MNYQQTLDYLYGMLPMYQRIGQAAFKTDLTNTYQLCEALGNPQEKFRSVHIAGTNGKGSSSHAMASVLQASGYKTGLYTSPHLKEFSERIRIDGKEIPQEVIVDWVAQHKTLIEKIQPSFFELTVAMAFDYFAREKVDMAVIEVGMGGRLDSTNVITPELSLITNIGFDHLAILGNTLPEIAAEKAGIIKRNRPVIIGEKQTETTDVFLRKAAEMGAPLTFSSDHFQVRKDEVDGTIQLLKEGKIWISSLKPDIGASYFLKNIPGIVQTLETLKELGFENITPQSIQEGLEKVISSTGLKGRWQQLSNEPKIIADVSHNPDGIRELCAQLNRLDYRNLFLIIGTVNDKDVRKVLSLLPKEAFYYFCQAGIPRAMPAQELAKLAEEFGLMGEIALNVNLALTKAKEKAQAEDLILITGSTFVVAEINEL